MRTPWASRLRNGVWSKMVPWMKFKGAHAMLTGMGFSMSHRYVDNNQCTCTYVLFKKLLGYADPGACVWQRMIWHRPDQPSTWATNMWIVINASAYMVYSKAVGTRSSRRMLLTPLISLLAKNNTWLGIGLISSKQWDPVSLGIAVTGHQVLSMFWVQGAIHNKETLMIGLLSESNFIATDLFRATVSQATKDSLYNINEWDTRLSSIHENLLPWVYNYYHSHFFYFLNYLLIFNNIYCLLISHNIYHQYYHTRWHAGPCEMGR